MSKLVNLQNSIIGRLTAVDATVPLLVPANGQVSWITENIGDLGSNIQKAIGKLGIIGIVMTPGGGRLYKPGAFWPISFRCKVEIQIQENVTINRGASGTQIASLDLVEFVMQRLHLFSPQAHRADRLELNEVPYRLVAETPWLVYNVEFNGPMTIGK
jgi:hypothetical protein